ncbi:MAG: DNA polymerase III subunit gamma/tau [Nitrospiraceae bacterium]|nr:DNA polymerase III subunit gamma/tau [Nitrospiraceae bacterium]
MSYLVLARKWRPQGFEDLTGQEPIIKILKNSISQNKIAHAYIFSGPRGVGKTTTARILAKALNCEKGPTDNPCGICGSCISVKEGTAIDVMEIDGASNNSVDDIRDLREKVKYTPLGGKNKIYIIDEAHMLSVAAFNALLKTLEEPPPHAVFVLATTAPKKIPVTIFSRCQHFPFRRISVHKIKDRLKHITTSEKINITDSALEMIARAADGSMRDSLTILDQIASFSSDINEDEVKDLLGVTDITMLSKVASATINGDREEIIKMIAELVDKGVDLKTFAKDLVEFFRSLLVAKIVKNPEDILELAENEIKAVKNILPDVNTDILTLIMAEIIKAESDARSAFSPRVALEMALIKASFLSSLKPVKEAIENIDRLVKELGSNIQPQPVSKEEPKTVRPPVAEQDLKKTLNPENIEDGKSLLDAILNKIDDPRISSKLEKGKPVLSGNILKLTFNSSEAEIFADAIKKNSSLIEGIASDIRGNAVKIEIHTETRKLVRKQDLQDKVIADPAVKEIVDLFDGRIVDVKIKEN